MDHVRAIAKERAKIITLDTNIASLKDTSDSTALDYKSGGELLNASFADGTKAKYDYQPSGLRAKLAYHDGRQTDLGVRRRRCLEG